MIFHASTSGNVHLQIGKTATFANSPPPPRLSVRPLRTVIRIWSPLSFFSLVAPFLPPFGAQLALCSTREHATEMGHTHTDERAGPFVLYYIREGEGKGLAGYVINQAGGPKIENE